MIQGESREPSNACQKFYAEHIDYILSHHGMGMDKRSIIYYGKYSRPVWDWPTDIHSFYMKLHTDPDHPYSQYDSNYIVQFVIKYLGKYGIDIGKIIRGEYDEKSKQEILNRARTEGLLQ